MNKFLRARNAVAVCFAATVAFAAVAAYVAFNPQPRPPASPRWNWLAVSGPISLTIYRRGQGNTWIDPQVFVYPASASNKCGLPQKHRVAVFGDFVSDHLGAWCHHADGSPSGFATENVIYWCEAKSAPHCAPIAAAGWEGVSSLAWSVGSWL